MFFLSASHFDLAFKSLTINVVHIEMQQIETQKCDALRHHQQAKNA